MAPSTPPPGFDPKEDTAYGYVPTDSVALVFLILFSVSTLTHVAEAIYFGMYWLLATAALAGSGEIIGWAARYWSSRDFGIPQTPFLMQISTTIIAPTFLLAVYFVLLGRLILMLGPQYSRLAPTHYTRIFLTADIVALVVQAVGGGLASSSNDNPNLGGNIMLGGIVFQLVSLVLYITLGTEFLLRYHFDHPVKPAPHGSSTVSSSSASGMTEKEYKKKQLYHLNRGMQALLGGMAFSLLCIFIRGIYRTIELSNGWSGRIIQTQVYFNVLDGMMILLASFALNILHPGFLLPSISSK